MIFSMLADVQIAENTTFTNQYVVPILPYFEILYYLCSFGLLIVAIIGLKQFVLTRRIAKANSRRDALKVSAEQCKNYADNILPLVRILLSKTHKLKMKEAFSVSVKNSTIQVKRESPLTDSDYKAFQEVYSDFANAFNAIESFSQYLTSGLADERNAYLCLGDLHLSVVKPFLPILVMEAQEGNMWCNTLRIYVIWYNRKQRDIVENKQNSLIKQERLLEKQKKNFDDTGISIIDVDTLCK